MSLLCCGIPCGQSLEEGVEVVGTSHEQEALDPIRDKFLSLFENIVLGSHKSFFQSNHQIRISLYLREAPALCHSREISWFRTILMYLQSINLLTSWTLKAILFHFIRNTNKVNQEDRQQSTQYISPNVARNLNRWTMGLASKLRNQGVIDGRGLT